MQSQNAGFILTSISYSNQKRDSYQTLLPVGAETKRTITKYDYCLPPEDEKFQLLKK